jgi:hypothetical protein
MRNPQTFVCNGVTTIEAGADGGFNNVLLNFSDLFKLLPQLEV